jgi:hypothetical protein
VATVTHLSHVPLSQVIVLSGMPAGGTGPAIAVTYV